MVPATFQGFFTSSAQIAGTLIGLLFVAISIAPDRVVGDAPSIQHQVKAATSFSALLDTLFVSLVAQLPGADLGIASIVLAVSGASTTLGLFVLLLRDRRKGALRTREVILLLVLLGLYGLQLTVGIRLARSPHDVSAVQEQAALLFGFVAFAVGRAWELVGARSTGLLSTIAQMTRGTARRSRRDGGGDGDGEAGERPD